MPIEKINYQETIKTKVDKTLDIELPFYYHNLSFGDNENWHYYGKVENGLLHEIVFMDDEFETFKTFDVTNNEIVDYYKNEKYKKITADEFELIKQKLIKLLDEI